MTIYENALQAERARLTGPERKALAQDFTSGVHRLVDLARTLPPMMGEELRHDAQSLDTLATRFAGDVL